jgi:hypothetical protein
MKKVLLSVAALAVVAIFAVIAVNTFTSEKVSANSITQLALDNSNLDKGYVIDAKCDKGDESAKCDKGDESEKCDKGDESEKCDKGDKEEEEEGKCEEGKCDDGR